MEPLTGASTFATIVSLLRMFKQERGDREKLTHQQFMEWIEYHRHEELKSLFANSAALRSEIDALLRSDHAEMAQKLDRIQEGVVELLGRVDLFRGLAMIVAPNAGVSEQSMFILREFVASGDDKFYCIGCPHGRFVLQLGRRGRIEIAEPRFVRDDLDQLVGLQLLTMGYSSNGDPVYRITRAAVNFIGPMTRK